MGGEFRFYQCRGCRTSFVSPTPTPQELERFYDVYHLPDEAGGMYDQVEDRMQADFPVKTALVKRECRGQLGRLLDVGCGKGFFVKFCRDAGIEAEGCDLSATGVEYARRVLGVPAHAGRLEDLRASLGTYDAVTCWATVEHLPDPVATVRGIYDVLAPGGRLFMDTGIGDDWLDRLLPGRVQWYDPPQHLWVFSAAGLRKVVENAGFRVQHHITNFERSRLRRVVKNTRNAVLALGLRAAAVLGQMRMPPYIFTRYPIGNLQSVVARKPGGPSGDGPRE
jgi:SAM-dependent methyltransferase